MYRLIFTLTIMMQAGYGVATNLAPEHELERLMIVAKESLVAGNYGVAREALDSIENLNADPGVDYLFYRGQLEAKSENNAEASAALVSYVNEAGKGGEYYQSALRLITLLEQRKLSEQNATTAASTEADQTLQSESQNYLSQLQELYLSQSPVRALTEHINSILAENIFVPGRLRHPQVNEGLVYKVSINSAKEVVVQESDYRLQIPGHSMRRAAVFGVDPYVAGECDVTLRMCWIYHPVEKQERWITIADNSDALRELSKAMSQLIRQLQN